MNKLIFDWDELIKTADLVGFHWRTPAPSNRTTVSDGFLLLSAKPAFSRSA